MLWIRKIVRWYVFVLLLYLSQGLYAEGLPVGKGLYQSLRMSEGSLQRAKIPYVMYKQGYNPLQGITLMSSQVLSRSQVSLKGQESKQSIQDLQSIRLSSMLDLQESDLRNLMKLSQSLTLQVSQLQIQVNGLTGDNSSLTKQLETCKESLNGLQESLKIQNEQLYQFQDRLQSSNEELALSYSALDAIGRALGDTRKSTSSIIRDVKRIKRGRLVSPILFTTCGIGSAMVAIPYIEGESNIKMQATGSTLAIGSLSIWTLGKYILGWW